MILYKRDFVIFGIFFLIILGGLARVVFNVNHSTDGIKVAQVQGELDKLRIENAELKAEILDQTSFRVILEKAHAMGFHEATPNDYIVLR
jgi:hypothetical protein